MSARQSTSQYTSPVPSQSIPRGTQWINAQSHLQKFSSESVPSGQSWLDDVEESVLLTLLEKKRSELDLLRSEAMPAPLSTHKQHSKRDSAIGIRNAGYSTSQDQRQGLPFHSGTHRRSASQDVKRSNIYSNATKRSPLPITPQKSDSMSSPPSPVSMLPPSPDFGPRRGSAFSGTVERRRSSAQFSEFGGSNGGDATTGASIPEEKPPGKRTSRNLENRVLWEAAWTEIDANIEEYTDKFSDQGGGRDKEMIWKSIVELGKEVRELKKSANRS